MVKRIDWAGLLERHQRAQDRLTVPPAANFPALVGRLQVTGNMGDGTLQSTYDQWVTLKQGYSVRTDALSQDLTYFFEHPNKKLFTNADLDYLETQSRRLELDFEQIQVLETQLMGLIESLELLLAFECTALNPGGASSHYYAVAPPHGYGGGLPHGMVGAGFNPMVGGHPMVGLNPMVGGHPMVGFHPTMGGHPMVGLHPIIGLGAHTMVMVEVSILLWKN